MLLPGMDLYNMSAINFDYLHLTGNILRYHGLVFVSWWLQYFQRWNIHRLYVTRTFLI